MNTNISIHESCYIDTGAKIGDGTRIWHYTHVQKNAVIGNNCNLGQNVNVASNVIIGNNVKLQNNVSVYSGVHLSDYVFCGPSCVFTNDLTPRCEYPKGENNYVETYVNRGATIGGNATIVCGVVIGEYALIGAGAVITKNVKNHAIMMGVPAKQEGWACRCGNKLSEELYCQQCGAYYTLEMDGCKIKED